MLDKIKSYRFELALVIITFITSLLMLTTFEYNDCESLTAWSVELWDCLVQGKLGDFYIYAAQNLRGAAHGQCLGSFLFLIPQAIWNLPVWVTHYFSGITSVITPACIIWSKLFFVFCTVVLSFFSAKICMLLGVEKKKAVMASILIAALPELMISTVFAGQDEIEYVCSFMMALYFYLEGRKKLFLLFSAISVTLFPVLLIPYIVLVLLMEKNILKDIVYVIMSYVPLGLFGFIFRNDKVYSSVQSSQGQMISDILDGTAWQSSYGSVSVFGLLIVAAFFICYFKKYNGDVRDKQYAVWVTALMMCSIGIFMTDNFYRRFICMPFLMVLIFVSAQNLQVNLMLADILIYIRMILCLETNEPRVMNTRFVMLNNGVLISICRKFGSERYYQDLGLYDRIALHMPFLKMLEPVIISTAIGLMMIMLVINHPGYKFRYEKDLNTRTVNLIFVVCMPIFLILFYLILFRP